MNFGLEDWAWKKGGGRRAELRGLLALDVIDQDSDTKFEQKLPTPHPQSQSNTPASVDKAIAGSHMQQWSLQTPKSKKILSIDRKDFKPVDKMTNVIGATVLCSWEQLRVSIFFIQICASLHHIYKRYIPESWIYIVATARKCVHIKEVFSGEHHETSSPQ